MAGIPIVQAVTGTDQVGRFDLVIDTDTNSIHSYTLVFGSHEFRTQKRRCLAFMDMKIEFYPPVAGGVPLAGTAEQSADQALGSK